MRSQVNQIATESLASKIINYPSVIPLFSSAQFLHSARNSLTNGVAKLDETNSLEVDNSAVVQTQIFLTAANINKTETRDASTYTFTEVLLSPKMFKGNK